MSDAYRTSAYRCPSCPDAPLREFQDRLVCDECTGMLLADHDLGASVQELTKQAAPVTVANGRPSDKTCPRCTRAMSVVDVTIGRIRSPRGHLRCEDHGTWFPRDALSGVFARASRSAPGHTRSGGGLSGDSPQPFGGGGMSGAIGSIGRAFGAGPASARLAISQWRDSRPRTHTLFVSAFKDRALGCPVCKDRKLQFAGDRWGCTACAGSFVEDAALAAMVSEMTHAPWEVPPVTGAGSDRPCPACGTRMIVEVLEAVTIDRCAGHGVWFDEDELQTALHHASEPKQDGVVSWVKRLFHRHGETGG
ncbi:MAG: zf-TFIIB domain-containing protein [Myxococcales bacterium]|nr:zf-TFIIB domain-containing protein [Myxococcales bacterium]